MLFLWASLYKPVIVAIAGLVMAADALNVWLAADGVPAGRRLWRAAQGPIISGGTACVGWALVFAYFAAVGRFAEFQEAVFAYNRDYAGSVVQNLLATLLPTGAVVWTAAAYFPLLVVIGIGAVWIAVRRGGDDGRLLLAYLVGAWIAVGMPGRLYPHYYQLLLPPLAIGAGWLIARALAARSTPVVVAVAAAVTLALTTRVYQSMVPVEDVPRLKFGGYGFDLLETQRMGPWIAAAPAARRRHVSLGGRAGRVLLRAAADAGELRLQYAAHRPHRAVTSLHGAGAVRARRPAARAGGGRAQGAGNRRPPDRGVDRRQLRRRSTDPQAWTVSSSSFPVSP